MSSVLFLPESAVFAGARRRAASRSNGVLAVSAVMNLLALYGAIRLAAGRAATGMRAGRLVAASPSALFGLPRR